MKKETVFIDEDTLTEEELKAIGDTREERLEAYVKAEAYAGKETDEQTAE